MSYHEFSPGQDTTALVSYPASRRTDARVSQDTSRRSLNRCRTPWRAGCRPVMTEEWLTGVIGAEATHWVKDTPRRRKNSIPGNFSEYATSARTESYETSTMPCRLSITVPPGCDRIVIENKAPSNRDRADSAACDVILLGGRHRRGRRFKVRSALADFRLHACQEFIQPNRFCLVVVAIAHRQRARLNLLLAHHRDIGDLLQLGVAHLAT